jgi:hypothetical protein
LAIESCIEPVPCESSPTCQFDLRIFFARHSRQLQNRTAASFETFFDPRSAAISQSKMAKFIFDIRQTVEKFKYRDANKEFHKTAI